MSRLLFSYMILVNFIVHKVQVYALQCYECNSAGKNQEACIDNPATDKLIKTIECNNTDTCITAIIDRATHRGCASSILPNGSCLQDTGLLCETCNTASCNKKIFPRDRRLCYQCMDTKCHNVTKDLIPTPCRNYVKDDECYSFGKTKSVAIRGCVSEPNKLCMEPRCLKCKTSGCNDIVTLTDHLCYFCSYMKSVTGSKDPSCKRPQFATEKCAVSGLKILTNKVLLGEKSKCFTWYNNYGVVMRGSSQSKGHLVNGHLSECEGDLCNNECIDIKCLQCDSEKNYKCINSTYIKEESCPAETNSCFACENKDGHVVRGCGSGHLEGYHCVPCYGDDSCNKQPIRTCYRCSSGFNPNCAKWVNISSIDLEVCKAPLDECVVTVKPNWYTVRGCRKTVTECTESDPFCVRCRGSLCNGGVFPVGRMHCYQCSGSDECDRGLIEPTPCTNYNIHDYCYAFVDDYGQIVRGCRSDDSFNTCRKLMKNGRCRLCYENECNRWRLQQAPTLKCIKCDKKNEACAWGYSEDFAERCKSSVPYHLNETCFTYKHKDGNVSRGCTLDQSKKLIESKRVQLCYSPGCNFKNLIFQSCIQCDTRYGYSTCGDTAANISSTNCKCGTPIQTFEKRGCFVKQQPDGYIVRGCSCQLDDDELKKCKSTEVNLCIHCSGQGCNTDKLLADSSNMILFKFSLMMFSAAMITIFRIE